MPIKVVSVKQFTGNFRGRSAEEWSNSYILTGGPPADAAAWDTLFDAIWDVERTVLNGTARRWHAYGYDAPEYAPGVHAVRGKSFESGTPAYGIMTNANPQAPLDMAAVARWRAGNTVKGKPFYIFKWFRAQHINGADAGNPNAGPMATNLAPLSNGSLPGGRRLCRPSGTLATTTPFVRPQLHSRDVKARGKRRP